MENLLEAIRAAVAPGATPNIRAAGVAACRTILAALEASVGEPKGARLPEPEQIAAVLGALRGVPTEQLLDLAIAKARSMLPADAEIKPVAPLKFITVPVPHRGQP